MKNFWLPVFLKAIAQPAKANFVRQTRQTMAVQEQFLLTLLKAYQNTELGRKFGLRDIKTIDQFCRQIPILPYSSYETYTKRIAQGEKNILTPDPVVYISLTSGSMGKQKMVPVTQRYQQSLGKSNMTVIGFLLEALRSQNQHDPSRKLQLGKLLLTNSAVLQGVTSGGINYGPVTVHSLRSGKQLYKQLLVNPYETLEIADSLSRHYVCLLFALGNPSIGGLIANFPMLVLRTCNYLEQYAPDLIEDLKSETLPSWLKLEPKMRTQLERRWVANPFRAAQLQGILQAEGRLTPKLAWPDLSLIITALGGTSDFYVERFSDYFEDTPVFGALYGTAEGNFGICHSLNNEGGILAIESGFYEFIPQDQWEVEQPKTLLPTEVETGKFYRILVTNYSGFYRYDIGDVVEVLGFYEEAPIIAFRHRRGGLLSSTTEKTTEFHATQVMQVLQQEFNLSLEDFCITLSEHEFPAHYLVNIELAPHQTLSDPQAFLLRFEHWLKETNNPYGTVRLQDVPPPRLRILSPGSFAVVRQRQLEKGMLDSYLKFPHISEDRNFLKGLTVLQEFQLPELGVRC
ncbi:MAG: GH3 auxin-responsive promoter family protein [Symploca sp. SIO2E6]|nr:GH3 auxin-responsive promoter family protein [Symploca sp. SIO2E6]